MHRRRRIIALIGAAALTLTGCSNATTSDNASSSTGTHTVTDVRGQVTVPDNPQRIVATDNTIFDTLAAWNIPLVAAPVSLLPSSSPYANDNNVQNLGTHREPNMELLVSVNPDLILNGQRFAAKYDEIKKLVPGAALLDVDAATIAGADATKDVQLRKQTELLGQVFNKQEQAQEIISEFDAVPSQGRIQRAYW